MIWGLLQKVFSVKQAKHKPLRIIYMGKDKPSVIEGLDWLMKQAVEIVAVVAVKDGTLSYFAKGNGLQVLTNKQLYKTKFKNIDLVISYLHPKRIKPKIINLPKIGCLNFHPAPLPKYRGVANYSRAILDESPIFGVTAHFIDEEFDTGDLIRVWKFFIPENSTAYSLEKISMVWLLELFKCIMSMILADEPLPRRPQNHIIYNDIEPTYTSIKDLDVLRTVDLKKHSGEDIERMVKAFWFPPFGGACIRVNGKEFTLVDKDILKQIKKWESK